MAAIPGIKYDDGLPAVSANCFPVRSFIRHDVDEEADGAWLVAQRAEQRLRFKAILCTKPKTYARIKEERRRAEKQGTSLSEQLQVAYEQEEEEEKDVPALDGFFLMRHCCVEDPTDLCSVNIAGKEISDVKEEDLALFDNVAYVNASENYLPFEAFRGFPILRELEMPLNGLRSIKPNLGDYPSLEVLDVSYNNLSQDDVLTLGLLSNVKVLHLTGNGFTTLPANMAMPLVDEKTKKEHLRFAKLEILLLDDNKLEDVSVFAALAGLTSLKHLNLEKNELYYVPMLKSVEGKLVHNDNEKDVRRLRRSAEKGGRKSSARGTRSKEPTPRQQSLIVKKEGSTEAPQPTPIPEDSKPTENNGNGVNVGNGTVVQPDLLNEEFTDLSQQITDIELDKEFTLPNVDEGNTEMLGDGSQLPPFPDLRALNLAYNRIEDEEALLAVAAWPMLVELIIHNNPLTTENSGDPPLLQRFLGDRLGIRIKRKQESDIVKPPVEVKMKKSRHVTTVVPKIPKLSVEALLMLEAPKPPSVPKPELVRTRSNLEPQKPLPPIPGTPHERQKPSSVKEDISPDGRSRVTRDEGQREVKAEQQDGDAFFMTQVDDQDEESLPKKDSSKKGRKHKKPKDRDNDKYKGYEILLDLEEDSNYSPPKDMPGNIKALKYALGHELVYRDPAVRLDRISKPVEPYRKTEYLKSSPRVTQGQKKEQLLTEMRDRVTTDEAGLQDVLEHRHKGLQERFPDSDRLLSEIQRRYNAVRVNSMKEARDAKKMLSGTAKDVKKVDGTRRVKMEV